MFADRGQRKEKDTDPSKHTLDVICYKRERKREREREREKYSERIEQIIRILLLASNIFQTIQQNFRFEFDPVLNIKTFFGLYWDKYCSCLALMAPRRTSVDKFKSGKKNIFELIKSKDKTNK